MEHEWDPRQGMDRQCQPQRDFLAEATRLALQLDPVSWEFDLTDRNVDNASDVCNAQQMYFNNTALATGTVMRDQITHLGTQSMCALYKPDSFPSSLLPEGAPLYGPSATAADPTSSNSGSEAEWDPDVPTAKHGKAGLPEQNRLKVRDRSRSLQRRWKQKYKEKQEEQRRSLESIQRQLEVVRKEKAAVEAHADVLEKALMKLSLENSKSQPQSVESLAFVPSLGWSIFDPRGSVLLSAVFDQPKMLTPKEAATVSLQDYARLWTEYVVKARECLNKIDLAKGSECPYLRKLKALLDERHGFLSWTSANNLSMVHKLACSNLDSNQSKSKATGPKSFTAVLEKLKLSEEQTCALVESRNLYLLSIGFHSAGLARLQSQLMALDPSPRESLRNSPYLKWTELSRALQEGVEEIHLSYVRLHFEVYHGEQALSPYQAGILLVECFPYIPDLIMLMRELATSQEAPSSQELLTKGAVRYAEKQGAADVKVSSEPYKSVVDKVSDLIGKVQLWEDSAGST